MVTLREPYTRNNWKIQYSGLSVTESEFNHAICTNIIWLRFRTFWIITLSWESYLLDECSFCSQFTTNIVVWQIRRSVWSCSTAIRTVLVPFHNRGRNMDSPQHNSDQAAFETVSLFGEIGVQGDHGDQKDMAQCSVIHAVQSTLIT